MVSFLLNSLNTRKILAICTGCISKGPTQEWSILGKCILLKKLSDGLAVFSLYYILSYKPFSYHLPKTSSHIRLPPKQQLANCCSLIPSGLDASRVSIICVHVCVVKARKLNLNSWHSVS